MAHQCLNCGKVFEDGSPYLLKGCPKCGGKRFFYIREPLSNEERKRIKKEVESKLEEKLEEIFHKDIREVSVKDIKEVIEDISEGEKLILLDEEERKEKIKRLLEEGEEEPETIRIEEPGRYTLNLKGLLEEYPIIIQKDGSYTIHLPSAFSMINKKGKED